MVRYPPLVLNFYTDTSVRYPILQRIARQLCDTPQKQARKSFAILSLQVSRDVTSIAAGPLRWGDLFAQHWCIDSGFQNLVAPYCAIPRDYLSDTPLLRALWGFWCLKMANRVRYPPPFLSISPVENMQSGAAIPPPLKRGISAILARYPRKTRQTARDISSAILSRKGIARYGGVSRTGPLSSKIRGFPQIGKIPTLIKLKLALPPPLSRNPTPPPPKRKNFMGMGFLSRKNQKMPGAHKIGAAISGPRIAGGKFLDMTFFLNREDL